MNIRGVLFLLGRLLLVLALALGVPTVLALVLDGAGSQSFVAFAVSAGLALVLGLALQRIYKQPANFQFRRREAFVLVTAAWVTASLVGALPYIFLKGPTFIVDGIFESVSGFTTTGATILSDIAGEPRPLLLWRSMTQWLGGMGIIVLGIAILPKLAVGGMELLGAEAPGPIQEKLTPRIAQTAKALWGIYVLLTGLEVIALLLAGLSPWESVNHAMTTVATSGFSIHDESIAGYNNPAMEWIITFFMIVAGANFALHFHLLRGRPGPLLRDREFRFYIGVIAVASTVLAIDIVSQGEYDSFLEAIRLTAFQTTSIVTTTGYATADFDAWPHFSRALLFVLMFLGGCAGSTGGSVKVVRVLIVLKTLTIYLKRLVQPRAVIPVRIGDKAIPDDVVAAVQTFLILFLVLFAAGGLALSLLGLDFVTAFSASAACLGNVGPAFGGVGPTRIYDWLPVPAKFLLVAQMLIGRLELYTVLVLFFLGRRGMR